MTRCDAFSSVVSVRFSTLGCDPLLFLRCVKLNIDFGRVFAGIMFQEGGRSINVLKWGYPTQTGMDRYNERGFLSLVAVKEE